MSYFKINVSVPIPTADGQEEIRQLEIDVNSDQVIFIAKQPLQPTLVHMLGVQHVTQSEIPNLGLHEFGTKEGGTIRINPDFVQFFFSPELGKYKIIFTGGATIVVPTTREDLMRVLEGTPAIEI